MSNLTINANSIYDRVIRIGRQTENLVSSITFNVNMWIEEYGAGECVLNVRRNGDANAYPVPMTLVDGMTTWTITDTDTARRGRGEIQLKYTVGEKVKTSPIFTISCGESLIGDGEPPSGYDDWLSELNRMTAQVEAAKTSADQSAQAAQTAAETAAEKASEAEQSATTASGFANNASASATSASTSAQAAAQSASQAASSVSDVEASAQAASQSAQSAESAKQAAQTASESSQANAQTASAKAAESAESAVQAQESVIDAQAEVTRASAEADRARAEAEQAASRIYDFLPTDSASGSIASFPDGADNLPLKSLVVGIEPVQDLHGYDNPWPAGGGKNLYSGPMDVIVDNQLFANVQVSPIPAGTYTLSAILLLQPAEYSTCRVAFRKANGNAITAVSLPYMANTRSTVTFTLTDICERIYFYYSASTAGTGNQTYQKVQIESGSTATSWSPYSNICPISGWTGMTANANGTEIPISWESEAGTVYGGTLDVLTGVLTVTKGFIQSYNGETLPSAWISDRDVYAEGATPTTGAEVCYDLAEPVTYQLSAHEVKSLLGQNNIYADTGDTSVEYRADIQKYINKKLGV